MTNKKLRILIAESQNSESLMVERLLNRLGYHRIATASTLDEARLLGRCTEYPFDVLIISGLLIVSEQFDDSSLAGISLNGLIYQSLYLPQPLVPFAAEGVAMRLPGHLDLAELDAFMALVDPMSVHHQQRQVAIQL
ncbi:chemotaxis protein CheY [Pseudomonas sp. PDM19]|uniref:chemotaxis protein CheY n=1 Tax=Pseudomonas sp. PDM19 TaxID=2769272 RepID=UPI0017876912|nr:chemotaxis protein CheY [Pseudomonas sp. PDM19]MBD9634549.1 chemotaxis protein CheY [Pseudomonas sp. PDM19]